MKMTVKMKASLLKRWSSLREDGTRSGVISTKTLLPRGHTTVMQRATMLQEKDRVTVENRNTKGGRLKGLGVRPLQARGTGGRTPRHQIWIADGELKKTERVWR